MGTLAIRTLFFILPSLLFLLFDSIIPSVSVSFKTQGESALPTRTSGGSRRGGRSQWYQVIGLSLFNIVLCIGIQSGVELLFTEVIGIRSALKVTTTLPMPWSILKDVGRTLVLREVCFIKFHCQRNRLTESRFSNTICTVSYSTPNLPIISANSTSPTSTR